MPRSRLIVGYRVMHGAAWEVLVACRMGNREETKRVAGASEASPPAHTPDTWERERSDLSGRAPLDAHRPTYGNHEALAGKERPPEHATDEADEPPAPKRRAPSLR